MRKPRNPQYAPGEDIIITEPCVLQVYHGHRGKFRVIRRRLKVPKIVLENIDREAGAA